MKTKSFFISLFSFSLLLLWQSIVHAAPPSQSVDVVRLTFNGNRDDWPVIYKDNVYWIDARGGIYGYNFTTKTEFPFFTGVLPFTNLYGLVAFNGRYIVYDSYDNVNYNVRIYDTKTLEDFAVSDTAVSRYATDIDGNTIAYIEGGGYGDLYLYDINQKASTFIAHNAAVPKISGNTIVWYISAGSGTYDIKVFDLVKKTLIDIPNPNNASRSVPDIDGNKIVYQYNIGTQESIRLFDLVKKQEITLVNTSAYHVNWPAISKKYVIWGKSTQPNVAGVEGVDLQTGEIFEVQSQGSFQNSNLLPYIDGNIAAWFDWRTGNGDIYSSIIGH